MNADSTLISMMGSTSWTVVTGNMTASAGALLLANTSAGSFTISLPASPSAGQTVTVMDGWGMFGLNNLTISASQPIMGMSDTFIFDSPNVYAIFAYTDAVRGWTVANSLI